MKKRLAAVLALVMILTLTSCKGNYQMLDTTYKYEYAIIRLPNEEIVEGKVESWRDYEDGDQVQICINGCTYLVHSNNAVLMTKAPK